jgi:adenylate kinase family enzyme
MAINPMDAVRSAINNGGILERPALKIGLMGRSGSGKTTVALNIALKLCPPDSDKKILYLDTGSNFYAIQENSPEYVERCIRLAIGPGKYGPIDTINAILVLMMAGNEKFPEIANTGVIIIDEMGSALKADLFRIAITRSNKLESDENEDLVLYDDRNRATNRCSIVMAKLNALPIPVIYTAHERDAEIPGPRTGLIKGTRSDLPRATAVEFEKDLHVLARCATMATKEDGIAYAVTTQSSNSTVKSRISRLSGTFTAAEFVKNI